MIQEAKDSLEKAQKRMKKYVDQNERPLEFKVGDMVLLKLIPQIWKKIDRRVRHRTLVSKYDGPFEVVEKVDEVAYRLKLPEIMKIHLTFHMSFLKPYINDAKDPGQHKIKRAPHVVCTQFEDEIKKIFDHRVLGVH